MKKNDFFRTKEGGLTIAFLAIMVAFVTIIVGLNLSNKVLCFSGLVIIIAAMLYSPCKKYIYDCRKYDKSK
jgi:hypothetical protein